MAIKTKTRKITVVDEKGTFSIFFKKWAGETKNYDFQGLSALRNLLSNEKARILHVVKSKKPNSIYSLAKLLGRDFKSVIEDVKLLEAFGFIDLISEKTGKRERLRPVVIVDQMLIEISI